MQHGKPVPGSELPEELLARAAVLSKEYSRVMMRQHHAETGQIQRSCFKITEPKWHVCYMDLLSTTVSSTLIAALPTVFSALDPYRACDDADS